MMAAGTGWVPRRREDRWIVCGLISILLGASTTLAHARDLNQQYKTQGLGLDTCASFLDVPAEKRGLYYSWLAGYLTAYNYLVRDTYSIAEYSGLTRTNEWLEKYCNEHPNHLMHEAVRMFVTERYRIRLKQKPEREDMLRFQERIPREPARNRPR